MKGPPLHHAARGGHGMVKSLLDQKADITVTDEDGQPVPHWAVESGDRGAARVRLEHGLEAGVRNNDGRTALQLAEKNGYPVLICLLSGIRHIPTVQVPLSSGTRTKSTRGEGVLIRLGYLAGRRIVSKALADAEAPPAADSSRAVWCHPYRRPD